MSTPTPPRPALSPHLIWAGAFILFTVISGLVVLGAIGADTAAIVSVFGAVLNLVSLAVIGIYGANLNGKVDQVRNLTNGTLSRTLDMVRDAHPGMAQQARNTTMVTTTTTSDNETTDTATTMVDYDRNT